MNPISAHRSGAQSVQQDVGKRNIGIGSKSQNAVKYGVNNEGRQVKMVRVRRKRDPQESGELSAANSLGGTQRVASTSELGRPAPVQGKTSNIPGTKVRGKSILPGLSQLVKKGYIFPANSEAKKVSSPFDPVFQGYA